MKDLVIRTVFKGIDKMKVPMTKITNRMDRLDRRIKVTSRRVDAMAKGFIRMGRNAAIGMTLLGGALANVTAAGMDFEQQMVNAAVKFPGMIQKGTKEFELLETAARSAGRTVEFTARDAAGGLNYLAMAGFTAKQAVTALPRTLDLATVSGADLGTATDYATDTLGAFGLMTKDSEKLGKNMGRVNDVLAKTANRYNVTIDQLFSTIRNAAAPAKAAGVDIETFSAMVGNLGSVGVKAFRAGTGIKNFALAIAAPTPQAEYMFKRILKVDTLIKDGPGKGDVRPIFDIINDVSKAVEGLGSGNRLAVLRVLFGKESITTAEGLMALGAEALTKSANGLRNIEGYSQRAATVMRNTFEGRWRAFLSRIESVKISLFDLLDGPLSRVLDKTTKWIEANEGLIASGVLDFLRKVWENMNKIIFALKLLVGAGGLVLGLAAALKVAEGAMVLFNIATGANPLGLFLATAGAVAYALTEIVNNMDLIENRWDKLWGGKYTATSFPGLLPWSKSMNERLFPESYDEEGNYIKPNFPEANAEGTTQQVEVHLKLDKDLKATSSVASGSSVKVNTYSEH